MEISRKKVLFINLKDLLSQDNGLTDFSIRQDILDKICSLNIQHVIILSDEKDAKIKTIEFFVFSYCKIAVSTFKPSDSIVDDVMAVMQHNIKKRDVFLSVGEKVDNIDNLTIEEFLCR